MLSLCMFVPASFFIGLCIAEKITQHLSMCIPFDGRDSLAHGTRQTMQKAHTKTWGKQKCFFFSLSVYF